MGTKERIARFPSVTPPCFPPFKGGICIFMIKAYCGDVGSGKTLSVIAELLPWLKMGYRVVSNIPISSVHPVLAVKEMWARKNIFKLVRSEAVCIPDIGPFLNEFTSAERTLFFIDEAGAWMDNYSWDRIPPAVYNRFFQHRKYEVHLLYTAQDFLTVAKKLRIMTNEVVECECVIRGPRDKRVPYSTGTPYLLRQIGYNPRFFNFSTYTIELEKKYIKYRKFLLPGKLKEVFATYDTKKDVSAGL